MARGEAERASTSSAMRLASALQHSKCREFEPSAQGRYWMARRGYLFSVALDEGIGGADISTLIASPIGITVDSAGSVIVANAGGGTVLKVGPTGEVSLLAGAFALHGSVDGRAADARFNDPFAVASDTAGNVYVSDLFNQTIRKISLDGMVSTVAGGAGSPGESDGTGEEARFNNPWGIAIDAAGDIFVADMDNHTIRKITLTGAAMGVSVRR